MKLLPAPRFHIMTPDEITQSMRRIAVEDRISRLNHELWRIKLELGSAEDHRDFMHKVGIYHPNYGSDRIKAQILEWYYS